MVRTSSDGSIEYAPPFKLSGHEFTVNRQAPTHGEHGAEILREAGFDAESIDALIKARVVRVS